MGIDLPWCGISPPVTHGGLWGTVLSPMLPDFPWIKNLVLTGDGSDMPHAYARSKAEAAMQGWPGIITCPKRVALKRTPSRHMPSRIGGIKQWMCFCEFRIGEVLLRTGRSFLSGQSHVGGSVRPRGDLSDRVLLGK